eukprot:g27009.t2
MTCTRCRTHFCYRCGKKLDPEMPYNHFSATGCTTFDTEEVRRMAMQQRDRQGQGFIDVELERLREEFGEQRDLFAQFERQRPGVRPERAVRLGRRNIADRLRNGEVQCPSCGQWNGRVGGLNHIRCGMCRGSYCGHCRRRIQGVITQHFRGEQACPQHMRARDSKGSPGRRRSVSTPSCPSRRTSVPASPSPFKATPSPAKPRRLWAGGPKISPNASPAKGTPPCRRRSASEGRLTATGEGQASSGARSERRPAREVKTATSRTASMGRSPARSPGRPGWSTPQAQKIRGEGGSPSPWAVPAMPEPSQSQGSIARSDTKGGSLLGTIIDDVAQLSAQVERLLNRRKDLLSDFQQTEEILREVVALSPSDASQEGDGRRRRETGGGMKPGQEIQATSPDGVIVKATIPSGLKPGQTFSVQYTAPAGRSRKL